MYPAKVLKDGPAQRPPSRTVSHIISYIDSWSAVDNRSVLDADRPPQDSPTNLHKIPDTTPIRLGYNRGDLRRECEWNCTDFQFFCPMLESRRDLRCLNLRGKSKAYSKENLERDQRVNDRGKVRKYTNHLHGR
jgi:hypothetical protein